MVAILGWLIVAAIGGGGGYWWWKRRQHARYSSPDPSIMRDNAQKVSREGIGNVSSSIKSLGDQRSSIEQAMRLTNNPAEIKQLRDMISGMDAERSFLVAANKNFSELPVKYDKQEYADAVKAIAAAKDLIERTIPMQQAREKLLDQLARNKYAENLSKAHDMSDPQYKAAMTEVALLQVARAKAIEEEKNTRSAAKNQLITGLVKGTQNCLQSIGRGASNVGRGIAAGGQGIVRVGTTIKDKTSTAYESKFGNKGGNAPPTSPIAPAPQETARRAA